MYNGMYKSYLLVGVRQNTHCSTETNPFYSFFSHVYKIISPISAMRQDGFTFFRCLFVPRSGSPSLNSRNDDDQQHYQQNAKGATSPNGFALSLLRLLTVRLCVCEQNTPTAPVCVCVSEYLPFPIFLPFCSCYSCLFFVLSRFDFNTSQCRQYRQEKTRRDDNGTKQQRRVTWCLSTCSAILFGSEHTHTHTQCQTKF